MRMTDGLTSSATDEWTTPKDLFDELNSEFTFSLDVASTDDNALCEVHYTKDDDGLSQEWTGAVWCNPPYGREIGKWIAKAASTHEGGVVVCLVPARTDTSWWHDYAIKASEIRFIRGRLRFGDSKNCAPFPSAILVFDDRQKRYWRVSK